MLFDAGTDDKLKTTDATMHYLSRIVPLIREPLQPMAAPGERQHGEAALIASWGILGMEASPDKP